MKSFDLNLGDTFEDVQSVVILTNDNFSKELILQKESLSKNKTINIIWSDLFAENINKLGFETEIFSIELRDNDGNLHRIYQNNQALYFVDKRNE